MKILNIFDATWEDSDVLLNQVKFEILPEEIPGSEKPEPRETKIKWDGTGLDKLPGVFSDQAFNDAWDEDDGPLVVHQIAPTRH